MFQSAVQHWWMHIQYTAHQFPIWPKAKSVHSSLAPVTIDSKILFITFSCFPEVQLGPFPSELTSLNSQGLQNEHWLKHIIVLYLPFYIIDRLSYLSSCLSFNFISFKPLFFWGLIFLVFVYLPNVDLKCSTASIIHWSPDSLFISVFLLPQCLVKKSDCNKLKFPCHAKLTLLPFSNNNMYLHQYISCTVLSCNSIR